MEFEKEVTEQIQKRILSSIKEINFLDRWNQGKLKIPDNVIQKAWQNIVWEEVIKYVSKELQDKVCQTIVHNMLTETKTDVKNLLSVEGVRQKIKMEAYPKIKEVLDL